MGKSSSGKDTIFRELMKDETLGLQEIVLYTTRPIRAGEKDGVDYHFVDDEVLRRFQKEEKVIELRCYNTVMGVWKYFTVDDEHMELERKDYLSIGTLVSYEKMRAYYGEERVLPIYVEVPDDIRLIRAYTIKHQKIISSGPSTGRKSRKNRPMRRCAAVFWRTARIFLRRIWKKQVFPGDFPMRGHWRNA